MPKNCLTKPEENDFKILNYNLYTNIKDSQNGRGTGLFIHNSLNSKESEFVFNKGHVEFVWAEVKLTETEILLVGIVYKSQKEKENDILHDLFMSVSKLKNYTHLLIMGDFNYPDIDWENWSSNDITSQKFIETVQDAYLFQHITKPTRHREGQSSNCLDLIFTNEEEMIQHIEITDPLGISDHCILLFDLLTHVYTERNSLELKRFIYDKADFYGMAQELSKVDWKKEMIGLSVDEMMLFIENKLNLSMEKYIPSCSQHYPSITKNKPPLWMNKNTMALIKKKHNAYKRWINTREGKNYEKYKKLSNKVKAATRKITKAFEKKLVDKIKTNPKAYWNYVNSKKKCKIRINSLRNPDGELTEDDTEKVDILNKFFTSVFTKEDLTNIPELNDDYQGPLLINIDFSESDIEEILKSLKIHKSPGPDNLHPRLLKELATVLSKPFYIIFRISIDTGKLPTKWKDAHVTPVFKSGDKSLPKNYRPISLTSIACKCLERLVRDAITVHMETNNLFTKHQHGFMRKRSCVTQLLESIEKWIEMIEQGYSVDVVYLDFQKAFDTVPHQRLMSKICNYGIRGNVFNWIEDFLKSRRQRVVSNSYKSEWTNVLSGVPQGSVLGPLLFVLFINDLPSVVNSYIKIFADDTKIFAGIKDENDTLSLQDDLYNLHNWSNKWQLNFNIGKCKLLHIGKKNPEEIYVMHQNNILTSIDSVIVQPDLGILMDESLNFSDHISSIVLKANKILATIKRSIKYITITTFNLLYKSLVRPHLEYCNAVWSPFLIKDIKMIEAVQRRATKLVPVLSSLSYSDRLKKLHLPTLQYRRKRGDMLLVYKLLNGFTQSDWRQFFRRNINNTRGHKDKLYKPVVKTNLKLNSFSNRIINEWNKLPEEVIESSDLNQFKRTFDKHYGDSKFIFNY